MCGCDVDNGLGVSGLFFQNNLDDDFVGIQDFFGGFLFQYEDLSDGAGAPFVRADKSLESRHLVINRYEFVAFHVGRADFLAVNDVEGIDRAGGCRAYSR